MPVTSLEEWFRDLLIAMEGKGGDSWRTHHVATIRKVRNRLSNIALRCAGLVSDGGAAFHYEAGLPATDLEAGRGLWLVAAPWFLAGVSLAASVADVAVGIAVIGLSLPRGRRSKEHYGSWDRLVL